MSRTDDERLIALIEELREFYDTQYRELNMEVGILKSELRMAQSTLREMVDLSRGATGRLSPSMDAFVEAAESPYKGSAGKLPWVAKSE